VHVVLLLCLQAAAEAAEAQLAEAQDAADKAARAAAEVSLCFMRAAYCKPIFGWLPV
jgi:hypothetical protein